MNVLVIGSGGREHALAYKIKQSRFLNNLFIAPGNPGTSMLGKNVRLKISDLNAVNNFCVRNKIDLVVIGPEIPIVQGLADHLRKNKIKVFAPDSKAAEIEAHKLFAKNLMISHGIPTAQFKSFTFAEYEKALDYLRSMNYPCIVKADGLASGKGVLICNSIEEAKEAVDNIFVNKIFGSAGDKLIIEEFMKGEEVSIFAITDGIDFICLPASQDHKRIEENDKGKNTGGMGAYSPASLITDELLDEIEEKIISPTLQALLKDGRRFIGCLYAGLMITDEGPKVVEFNCRFGDPETQAVLPLLKGDFLQLLYSAASGKIDKSSVEYNGGSSVCVVCASGGYPGSFKIGYEIKGLETFENDNENIIYHAGTKEDNDKIVTNGGRVLGVTSVIDSNNLKLAKKKAYQAVQKIYFENIYYRKDIADKGIIN